MWYLKRDPEEGEVGGKIEVSRGRSVISTRHRRIAELNSSS